MDESNGLARCTTTLASSGLLLAREKISHLDHDMDAAFYPPHIFVGGPQTPGLLVARRTLFQNTGPTRTRWRHHLLRTASRTFVPCRHWTS